MKSRGVVRDEQELCVCVWPKTKKAHADHLFARKIAPLHSSLLYKQAKSFLIYLRWEGPVEFLFRRFISRLELFKQMPLEKKQRESQTLKSNVA